MNMVLVLAERERRERGDEMEVKFTFNQALTLN